LGIEELLSLRNRACGQGLNVDAVAFMYNENTKVFGVRSSWVWN